MDELPVDYQRQIFVFGSNLAGRHGKGAALCARLNYGAITGQGVGLMNDCYAIPTKGFRLEVLPLQLIAEGVRGFLAFAFVHQHWQFHVTRIGCGLAGYTDPDIAPMFRGGTPNVVLDPTWTRLLADG